MYESPDYPEKGIIWLRWIAILSPAGYTPLCTINPINGSPDEVVDQIVKALEGLIGIWAVRRFF